MLKWLQHALSGAVNRLLSLRLQWDWGRQQQSPKACEGSTTTKIQITTTGARHLTEGGSQSWWSSESPDTSWSHDLGCLQKWNYRPPQVWVQKLVSQASAPRYTQSQMKYYRAMSQQVSDLLWSLYSIGQNKNCVLLNKNCIVPNEDLNMILTGIYLSVFVRYW